MAVFDANDPNANKKIRRMMGPGHVDQQLRQAIQFCWVMLPENRRTVEEVEKQISRMLKRAIEDLREDTEAFLGEEP